MNNKTNATIVPIELLKKYDRPGPRYTSYPTAPMWTEQINNEAYKKALQESAKDIGSHLALYGHVPFCKKRCYYCGCNTCITNKQSNVDEYTKNLIKEINATADSLGKRNKVSQLHFGGGTPTFLDVEGLDKILSALESRFAFINDCEKSIELDPRVTTTKQLEFLTSRGFNRVSLGVQDFDSDVQKAIGRIQSEEQVRSMTEQCRNLEYKGINFDLIYGLPRQTVASFERTLEKTIEMRPDRLAVYSFAFLPKLKSNQMKINPDELPTTDVKYQLFAKAIEMFTKAGYLQIGMDHFALPDDELALAQKDGRLNRNFMGYTTQAAPDMIGFGMSSIGYINNSFFQNHSKIGSYKTAVTDNNFAVYRGMILSDDDLVRQRLITSLMCNFVICYQDLMDKFGIDYNKYFAVEHQQLNGFIDDGLLKLHEDRLELTEIGRTFVRNIAMTYDAYLNKKNNVKKATFSRTI